MGFFIIPTISTKWLDNLNGHQYYWRDWVTTNKPRPGLYPGPLDHSLVSSLRNANRYNIVLVGK